MTLKEALPILTAIADGAEWEWQPHQTDNWVSPQYGHSPLTELSYGYTIRIKPAPAPPKYVPLGPEDVPPGSVVSRQEYNTYEWTEITAVADKAVYCGANRLTYKELFDDSYQINRSLPLTGKWDATAWEPCKKLKA